MSEILLYHARVLELREEYQASIDLLDTGLSGRRIVDRSAALEARARLLSKLGRTDDADRAWREIIDLNPDSLEYYESLLSVHGVNTSESPLFTLLKQAENVTVLISQKPRTSQKTPPKVASYSLACSPNIHDQPLLPGCYSTSLKVGEA